VRSLPTPWTDLAPREPFVLLAVAPVMPLPRWAPAFISMA
jgi:hypothetical protein